MSENPSAAALSAKVGYNSASSKVILVGLRLTLMVELAILYMKDGLASIIANSNYLSHFRAKLGCNGHANASRIARCRVDKPTLIIRQLREQNYPPNGSGRQSGTCACWADFGEQRSFFLCSQPQFHLLF